MSMMKKIYDTIKNIVFDKKLYIYAVITIAFFGTLCHLQYAPDTYSVLTTDIKGITAHMFSCGRFVTGIFLYLASAKLKLGSDMLYYTSYSMAMIFMILSLYKLDKIIAKEVKNRFGIIIVISTLIILNVFSVEMFLYIEKGIMVLSVLLCVLALGQIINFFNGKKRGIVFALVYMCIANCCYQGNVGLFFAIAIVFAMKYSTSIKKFIVNNLVIGLVYAIPATINLLLIRLLYVNTRVKGDINFSESIKKIIDGTNRMITYNYGMLPKGLFITAVILLCIIIIIKLFRSSYNIKKKLIIVFSMIYLIVGTIFVTVLPQLMQDTNSIWFVVRSSYPMGCLIGTILLSLYIYFNDNIKFYTKLLTIIISIIVLLNQFIIFNRLSIDNYIVNSEDQSISIQIKEIVDEYQIETGMVVDKIAIYTDMAPKYTYDNILVSGDMNIKAYSTGWSTLSIVQYYLGKNLKSVECDQNIEQYFFERNWDDFSKEQIICRGNTLHICIF